MDAERTGVGVAGLVIEFDRDIDGDLTGVDGLVGVVIMSSPIVALGFSCCRVHVTRRLLW
jgi:hypothetical protein